LDTTPLNAPDHGSETQVQSCHTPKPHASPERVIGRVIPHRAA
jgi:hypothetical protein